MIMSNAAEQATESPSIVLEALRTWSANHHPKLSTVERAYPIAVQSIRKAIALMSESTFLISRRRILSCFVSELSDFIMSRTTHIINQSTELPTNTGMYGMFEVSVPD